MKILNLLFLAGCVSPLSSNNSKESERPLNSVSNETPRGEDKTFLKRFLAVKEIEKNLTRNDLWLSQFKRKERINHFLAGTDNFSNVSTMIKMIQRDLELNLRYVQFIVQFNKNNTISDLEDMQPKLFEKFQEGLIKNFSEYDLNALNNFISPDELTLFGTHIDYLAIFHKIELDEVIKNKIFSGESIKIYFEKTLNAFFEKNIKEFKKLSINDRSVMNSLLDLRDYRQIQEGFIGLILHLAGKEYSEDSHLSFEDLKKFLTRSGPKNRDYLRRRL